jgi:hypothetical protein
VLRKHSLSTGVLLLFVLLAFGSVDSPDSTTNESSDSNSSEVSSISWAEVNQIYNLASKVTELRKEEEWKQFKGKRIQWTGTVSSISESFGILSLQIKMNPETFTSDLLINLKENQRSKAIDYSEGDRITFSGLLEDWGTLMPITLSDGEIVE